jgi:large subunit ribosomal protein L10
MLRTEKAEAVEAIKDTMSKMSSAVFVNYAGMTVSEVSDLRNKFREKGVKYQVLKNTLIKLAMDGESYADELSGALSGMTAVAFSFEEPSAAARIIKAYRKDNEKLVIKAGLMDGSVMDDKGVEHQLATLPSKDEARSMLLATFMAPAQTMVRLLSVPLRDMVGVLDAKRRKDEG